jgi:Tol biopolymer transport system component
MSRLAQALMIGSAQLQPPLSAAARRQLLSEFLRLYDVDDSLLRNIDFFAPRSAEPDRPKVWNLWLLTVATGELRRLTRFSYGQTWAASWLPDGRRVVFSHEDRLLMLSLSDGRVRSFKTPVPGRIVRTPAVSPDGRRVLFQVWRDGAWLLDLATGDMDRLLADPTAEEFAWSPDGRRFAYHSRAGGRWAIRVSSG